jgi:hypothetical protein
MRLLTVGDSFTYGDELEDITSAWPFLLATKLEYQLDNKGRPAVGNTSMIRTAVENVDNYDFIIIAWSHFARTETADELGVYNIWPGCTQEIYKISHPWRGDLINYINRHHNDQYLYRQYLLNIILIQNFLKNNNKRYLMLDAFGNNLHRDRRVINTDLTAQIDTKYFVGWPTTTMMEWTWGVEQGPHGHFLELGHRKVAEKIYTHMEQLSWVS